MARSRSRRTKTPKKQPQSVRTNENELTHLALRACLIASDAASNSKEFLENSSRLAFLAVRDCEKELDRIEQEIDEQLPSAISDVGELEARELLACLRFSTDLERIGDLLWGVAQRAHNLEKRLPKSDLQQLIEMLDMLTNMLQRVREGFVDRNLEPASYVLRADREIDQMYKALFRRHVHGEGNKNIGPGADAILMAQALERAGDHATNLAEELFRLIGGRSLRHTPKRLLRD
jgi:phosphate transport system protein